MKRVILFLIVLIVCLVLGSYFFSKENWTLIEHKILAKKTTEKVVQIYGLTERDDIKLFFKKANIAYPPKKLTFLAMKDEKQLEVWASNGGEYAFIRSYQIHKLSGKRGPKLREGDFQVPEGLYKIIGFNPNSAYHLSMKLNYPNKFDLLHAKQEGRTQPGTNIFIHGKAVSIGCLAMGDKTIEELFVLSKDVGINNIEVVISPYDPRINGLIIPEKPQPKWLAELYRNIEKSFKQYKK